MRLNTANGTVLTKDRTYVEVPGLDWKVEAIVLSEGEPALSVGKLIKQGFSFIWKANEVAPIVFNPVGHRIFV